MQIYKEINEILSKISLNGGLSAHVQQNHSSYAYTIYKNDIKIAKISFIFGSEFVIRIAINAADLHELIDPKQIEDKTVAIEDIAFRISYPPIEENILAGISFVKKYIDVSFSEILQELETRKNNGLV